MLETGEIAKIVGSVVDEYGVGDVYLYGSYARGNAQGDSAVDLVIEPIRPLGAKRRELEAKLASRLGRDVEVVYSADQMPDPLRRRFDEEKVKVYERPRRKGRVRTIEYDE